MLFSVIAWRYFRLSKTLCIFNEENTLYSWHILDTSDRKPLTMPKRLLKLFMICLLMVPFLLVSQAKMPSTNAQATTILLKAPRKIQVGNAIRVQVRIRGAANVRRDSSHGYSLIPPSQSLAVFQLGKIPSNGPDGTLFLLPPRHVRRARSLVLLPARLTTVQRGEKGQTRGVQGNLRLATFFVVPLTPGQPRHQSGCGQGGKHGRQISRIEYSSGHRCAGGRRRGSTSCTAGRLAIGNH